MKRSSQTPVPSNYQIEPKSVSSSEAWMVGLARSEGVGLVLQGG